MSRHYQQADAKGENVKKANQQDALAEQLLIEQARSGSSDAFAELVSMHSPQIYSISLRILQNHADAEDNVQDALWKAYEGINRFEGRSRFSTWLIRIAINEALMRMRAVRPVHLTLDALTSENEKGLASNIRDDRPDPERQYLAKELTAKAFLGLPPSLIDMFVRNKVEGWSNRELAREIGITLSALKSRMFEARGRMREHLRAAC
jgi:RNA polymerase sigma-70 factor, ECF subfamily